MVPLPAYAAGQHSTDQGRDSGPTHCPRARETGVSNPQAYAALVLAGRRGGEDLLAREGVVLPLFHEQVYRFARPELEGMSLSYWMLTVSYDSLSIRETARAAAI